MFLFIAFQTITTETGPHLCVSFLPELNEIFQGPDITLCSQYFSFN